MKQWLVVGVVAVVLMSFFGPVTAIQHETTDRSVNIGQEPAGDLTQFRAGNNSSAENVGTSGGSDDSAEKTTGQFAPGEPTYNSSFAGAVPALALQNRSSFAPNRTLAARGNATATPAPPNASRVVTYSGTTASGETVVTTSGTNRSVSPQSTDNGTVRSQVSVLGAGGESHSNGPRVSAANTGIVGADTRERITDEDGLTSFPWAPIVELRMVTQDDRRGGCSGVVITEEDSSEDSYHVLTAGHCVYVDGHGGWIDIEPPSVDGDAASHVVPAANASEAPFGRVEISRIRSYDGWTDSQDPAYDMALLTLERRIGSETGSMGYVGVDDANSDLYTHTPTRVTGYPGDKPRHTMWTSTGQGLGTFGPATVPEATAHIYDNDIFSGMSGGPTWVEDRPEFDRPRVVSVNAYAVDSDQDGETEYNQGTRITNSRFDDLQRWMAEDDPEQPENDRFEPNDDFSSATDISPGRTYDDLRIVGGEWDVFAVDLAAGERLTANASFDDSTGDLDLFLYHPNQSRADASRSTTDDEQVTGPVAPQAGTYYVGVHGYEGASAPYDLRVAVTDETVVEIRDNAMCTDVQESEPYDCPSGTVSETFDPTDERAVSWLRFGEVDEPVPLTWRFYTPSGELYRTVDTVGNQDGGYEPDFRAWAWVDIAGTEAASTPGEWRVEVDVDDRQALTDSFTINSTASEVGTVTFDDQSLAPDADPQAVTVAATSLSGGGFVAVHRGSPDGAVLGHSQYLGAGSHEDVRVELETELSGAVTLVAVPYLDANGDSQFDPASGDDPYTDDGAPVSDAASVSVESGDNNDDGDGPTRTLSSTTAAPGSEVTVTVETTLVGGGATINEAFDPAVGSASIAAVTVDGESVSPFIAAANHDGAVVTLDSRSPGSNATVEYTVEIPDDAESGTVYAIDGSVTHSEGTVALGRTEITVTGDSPLDGAPGRYDSDGDGEISIGELSDASVDFVTGDLPIAELAAVAQAFSQS